MPGTLLAIRHRCDWCARRDADGGVCQPASDAAGAISVVINLAQAGGNRSPWGGWPSIVGLLSIVFAQGVSDLFDSADESRLQESCDELASLVAAEKLQHASVLVLANKRDLDAALPMEELAKKLGVGAERQGLHVAPADCRAGGEDLLRAMEWLIDDIAARVYI